MKVSRTARFWLGTLLWCGAAGLMVNRGLSFYGDIGSTSTKLIALGVALVFGTAKGYFVISKSATRNARYIFRRPERDWFFLCFHPIMFILIPIMILMGRSLRHYAAKDAPAVILAVYVGIGPALLVAVRGLWKARAEESAGMIEANSDG